jgi:hypothetical protein
MQALNPQSFISSGLPLPRLASWKPPTGGRGFFDSVGVECFLGGCPFVLMAILGYANVKIEACSLLAVDTSF